MELNTIIKGSGHYLPENIVKNEEFLDSKFFSEDKKPIDLDNKEIISKFKNITGIEERRYVSDDLINSQISTISAQRAIENAKIDKEQIAYIIVAHNFGDIYSQNPQVTLVPSISSKVKHNLGIVNPETIVYDIIFGCAGWLEGIILGHKLIKSTPNKFILVIGSDILSRAIDPYDRDSMIFSDGAGAVILSNDKSNQKKGILYHKTLCHCEGEIEYLTCGASLNPDTKDNLYIKMKGRKIYEYAINKIPILVKESIDKLNLGIDDINCFIIHQANKKIDETLLKEVYKLYGKRVTTEQMEKLMPITIDKFGNSSVATIPTIYDMISRGKIDKSKFASGDNLVFISLGASMSINILIYRVP